MPDFTLDKLMLENIGPFGKTEVLLGKKKRNDLANVHLFTGPNGSGKSTILEAMAEIFRQPKVFGRIRERFRAPNTTVSFEFSGQPGSYGLFSDQFPPSGHYGRAQTRLRSGNQFFECADESLANYKIKQSGAQNAMGDCYSFAAFAYSGLRSLNVPALTAIEPVRAHPLDHALDFHNEQRSQLLLQWIANNRTQSALAHQDNDQAAVEKYDYALGRITDFFKQVTGQAMEFRLQREPLEVVLRVSGEQVPLNVLPDGVKSMLSWMGDLVLRMDSLAWCQPGDIFSQPIFLFLDEIDIHLHPKWQRLILPAVQRLFSGAQVFVSTHSPFVVGSVEDAWVYRLPEPNTTSEVRAEDSGAGKSYSVVLREIFSLEEEFDPQTEALFERFYEARNRALATQGADLKELLESARLLEHRGVEAQEIVARELRQLSRRTGLEIA